MQKLFEGEYFGRSIRKLNLEGFILTEKVNRAGDRLPKHAHENAYFCTVLKGNWLETVNSRERACRPMSIQYHPSGEAHSDNFGSQEAHTFNIELSQERMERFRSYSIIFEDSLDFYRNEVTWLALKVFQEFKSFDAVSPLAVEGLICELMASVARQQSEEKERSLPSWLIQAREIVDESFAETISLTDIALRIGVHPVHLARTFRKFYRCTIGDYQRRRRIEFSCYELSDPGKSLIDIALRAGFYDQSHFTRSFRKLIGVPPAKYRSWVLKC